MVQVKQRKLKRVVIKEELVALTEDAISALILNQFLYWSERVRDFDRFIDEERRRGADPNIEPTSGWIYKSIADLGEEIMLNASEATIRRRIDDLVEAGYLEKRESPQKWDRTLQYRPHIYNIQQALFEIGYVLDGYPLQFEFETPDDSTPPDEKCIVRDGESTRHHDESTRHHNESARHHNESARHHDASTRHSDASIRRGEQTIPEITTETTTKNTNKDNNKDPRDAGTTRDGPRDRPPNGGVVVADFSESERRAFEMLRDLGFQPERLAREYAVKSPESAYRWAIYARSQNLGAGFVRKHLDAGDDAPDLNAKRPNTAPSLPPPPPAGRVYR